MRGMMEMSLSISEIARRMGRHRSTIRRELERNRCVDGYGPASAARRAWARKLRGSKVARSARLRAQVEDRLALGWSPEQIAGADGARRIGSRDQRGVHLPPCLQPGRSARRAAGGSWRNASRNAAVGDETGGASRPSPTARRSISGRQKPIFAASSAIGRAT